jgi:hypothetical protein
MSHASTPFQWGRFDCCLFAADAIQAITKVDIASEFRNRYHDQASAFALIKQITGGTTVADAAAYCATKHGMSEWTYPMFAQRGDLVVFENGSNLIAGVVNLSGTQVVSVSESGLVTAPVTAIRRAWRVPIHHTEKLPAGRLKSQ